MTKMEPFGGCQGHFDVLDLVRMDERFERFELREVAGFDISNLARA